MSEDERPGSHERWAHLRFGVVGGLLASPPAPGELRAELLRLAEKPWRHPTTGELVRFGLSTVERWYYAARAGSNPVGVLHRKLRQDSGRFLAITDKVAQELRRQYQEHPRWSYKLHLDNLAVRIERAPDLGVRPSYPTVRRFMVAQGLLRQARKRGRQEREGEIRARDHALGREVRSYESVYVSGLWHLDFHHGSLKVLRPKGEWVTPILLGILDDRSRLVCHAQWYLDETAESLVHGLVQAFLKRGLPAPSSPTTGPPCSRGRPHKGLPGCPLLIKRPSPTAPTRTESRSRSGTRWKDGSSPCWKARRISPSACSTKPPRPGWRWNTTARSIRRLRRPRSALARRPHGRTRESHRGRSPPGLHRRQDPEPAHK